MEFKNKGEEIIRPEGRRMTTPEGRIKTQIRKYARSNGVICISANAGIYEQEGIPDLIMCIRGRFVAVEVKVPGGKLRPSQESRIPIMRQQGAIVLIVTSLNDLKDQLDSWMRSLP